MTSRPRVVVTRRLPPNVEQALAVECDAVFNTSDRPFVAADLQRALGEADGVLTTVTDRITAEVLATNPIRARIIANFGAGVDNIAVAAAAAHDIVVTNTPDVLTDDTADLAIALILMAMRRAGEGERELRGGRWTGWRPTHLLGRRVTGVTLGIVGLGRIGQAVAQRAAAGFGMTVRGWGRTLPDQARLAELGVTAVSSLDHLLATCDVVSLHLPGGDATHRMIDSRRLALMPSGSVLVNTARGGVVDTDALVGALMSGHLSAAGLDVYPDEPTVDQRLLGMEQVVLLPHLGSATREGREQMGMLAVTNLRAFFAGELPPNLVRP
jgi:lactate dehydrogenase-like 2-hydroxyacid dehydrogenase